VRRVLYRYFKFVLVPAKAVSRTPSFFANYLDKDSEDCMFIEIMLKLWNAIHFSTCRWYLDCPIQKPPSFEITLRKSLEPALVGKVSKALVMSTKAPPKRTRKRKIQHHVVDVLNGENEYDTDIIELSQQVNVVGLSSPRSKRPKFTHQVPIPHASSSPAPLSHLSSSMKGRMQNLHDLPYVSSSKSLILNYSFVRMVEERQRTKEWPPAYEDIRFFFTTVINFTLNFLVILIYIFQ
jgi:hypothetical protein